MIFRLIFVGPSQFSKRPCQSGYHNRVEICFSGTAQVWNLPTTRFFSIRTHLDVRSWMVSSEIHLTGLTQVVNVAESKSVCLALSRFQTCRQQSFFFLSEPTLTFGTTHGWFPQRLLLTSLSQEVTITESKSVSLGMCRFETCWSMGLFLSEHTFAIDLWMVSSEVRLSGLSQVVITTESKSVSLGVGWKPAVNIFVGYRSFFSIRTHVGVHSWMVSSEIHLTSLTQGVNIAESNSISVALSRFETCRQQGFFFY